MAEKKKRKPVERKPRERKPTDSMKFVPGPNPDWFYYPREWDLQNKKLVDDIKVTVNP